MNKKSVLAAKLQDVTAKNCSVANYQGADQRKLPSGLDKLQQREALPKCYDRKNWKCQKS